MEPQWGGALRGEMSGKRRVEGEWARPPPYVRIPPAGRGEMGLWGKTTGCIKQLYSFRHICLVYISYSRKFAGLCKPLVGSIRYGRGRGMLSLQQ